MRDMSRRALLLGLVSLPFARAAAPVAAVAAAKPVEFIFLSAECHPLVLAPTALGSLLPRGWAVWRPASPRFAPLARALALWWSGPQERVE